MEFGGLRVAPIQWTVKGLGFMRLPGGSRRVASVVNARDGRVHRFRAPVHQTQAAFLPTVAARIEERNPQAVA